MQSIIAVMAIDMGMRERGHALEECKKYNQ
jgi:hypothetical protein